MGNSKYANGGLLKEKLDLPNVIDYGVNVNKHGENKSMDMKELGKYIKDVIVIINKSILIYKISS